MSSLFIKVDGELVQIEGQLTRQQLTKAFIVQHNKISQMPKAVIDLANVSKIDTAGLAWLLLIVEETAQSKYLKFKNLPSDLLKLAKLSGVETFLSLA